jgi:hypothetical protein
VLPLDGHVFWIKANPLEQIVVTGSLHYASDSHQEESGSFTVNSVVFTSEEEINDLNDVSPNEMWIADFDELGPSLDYSDPLI